MAKRTALLITDNQKLAKYLRLQPDFASFSFRHYPSFSEGINYLSNHSVSVILLNPKVNGMSGRDFLQAIERQKRVSAVPYFLLENEQRQDKYSTLLQLRAESIFDAQAPMPTIAEKIQAFASRPVTGAQDFYRDSLKLINIAETAESLRDFLRDALYSPAKLTDSERAIVYIRRNGELLIEGGLEAAAGLPGQFVLGEGIVGLCAESGLAFMVNNMAEHPELRKTSNGNLRRTLVAPLQDNKQTIGVLQVVNKDKAYTTHDREVLEHVARILSGQINRYLREGSWDEGRHWQQNVINGIEKAFIICSAEGRIIQANEEVERYYGAASKELLGQPLANVLLLDDAGTDPREMRGVFQPLNGPAIPLSVTRKPVGGSESGYLIYYLQSLDTNIAQPQPDVPLSESKDFMAMTVHDVKNPLTNIVMAASILQHHLGETNLHDLMPIVEQISTNAKRASNMLGNLLDYTRGSSGDLPLQKSVFSLAGALQDAIRDSDNLARAKGIEIDLHVEEKQLFKVSADRELLDRVWANLLANAIKFSPDGSRIDIVLNQQEIAAVTYCCVSIVDSGPGIAPALRERIFDRFFREASLHANAPQGYGTGLGLTIAKLFVEKHGGRIEVENIPDRGAKFSVFLHLAEEIG
jgi:nitrogen-specific signal transduction histidine kinase/putative methionine-R-sulfoxide reductase with GAF domain